MLKNREFRLIAVSDTRFNVEVKVAVKWVDAGVIYKTPQGNWMFIGAGGPSWKPTAEEAGQAKANDWWYN